MPGSTRGLRRFAMIAGINGLVLVALFVCAEVAARVSRFALSCLEACELRFLANPPRLIADKGLGFRAYDPVVGYRNVVGFSAVIDPVRYPSWRSSLVTITPDGFRSNRDDRGLRDEAGSVLSGAMPIIAAGDSFTFGDQVNNSETWPACLERRLRRPVHNAGVSGYGGAQAMLALERSAKGENDYALAILSILVGRDFWRDQHVYLNGFPHPAVVGTSLADISHTSPPSAEAKGSRFATRSHLSALETLAVNASGWSWLLTKAGERRRIQSYALNQRTDVHPDAAPAELIAQWTLHRLALVPTAKLLVLQYELEPPSGALAERQLLLATARDLGIPLVDTFDALAVHPDRGSLYVPPYGHHTPAGNDLVCREIASTVERLFIGQRRAVVHGPASQSPAGKAR